MELGPTFARFVVELNKTAQPFQSSIVLKTDSRSIDVKSILGLTHSVLTSKAFQLEIHGPDEEQAKQDMVQVFRDFHISVEVN
ncbi:HPr family phosphocarrier protein [Domibacillus sp. A3M-37]|uniref:HPr family phosphocarrier protein n=1 Tax=Domibacillus TaxID=1433999 RepID=UPI0006180108|nr:MULTISPECIES: HPr family phosphocarrier protein [Domibacillus]MCP3763592.1 HPr family phosphocarrier protein [Domibacillus sp. A3M-37]